MRKRSTAKAYWIENTVRLALHLKEHFNYDYKQIGQVLDLNAETIRLWVKRYGIGTN